MQQIVGYANDDSQAIFSAARNSPDCMGTVMRWGVEISDLAPNRRLLTDVLDALSMSIREEEGRFFLESDHFEKLATPSEVHAYASRVRSIAEEVRNGNPEIDCSFSVGSVIERSEGGVRRHHVVVVSSTLHLHCSANAAVVSTGRGNMTPEERARQECEQRERKYADLRKLAVARVVSAVRHDRALTVQQLLREEQTPQVLGHIMEFIQDDLGAAISKLVSETQKSRFYRSINHPKVFGKDARHIVSHQRPPPDPMHLNEARQFLRAVAEKWLIMKSSDLPNL